MINQLILFGATGDLAGRFILPALAELAEANLLPDDFRIMATSNQQLHDAGFRKHAEHRLKQHASHLPNQAHEWLLQRCRYQSGDATSTSDIQRLLAMCLDEPTVYYLALPTLAMPDTLRGLATSEMPSLSRIAIEKPFGHDLESAIKLADLLTELFGDDVDDVIFNVDHVLGRTLVQALPTLRASNPLIEALWNSEYIEEFQILWEETIALEGRAEFYDTTGALKDVMQNHLMQVLAMSTMEHAERGSSGKSDAQLLRERKIELLQAVRRPVTIEAVEISRRARYTAGTLAEDSGSSGRHVPDYVAEVGVDEARQTETFAEVVVKIDSPRWNGTTFRLRTGKALAELRKGIEIHFRASDESTPGGKLWVGLNGPNTIDLELITLGHGNQLTTLQLHEEQPKSEFSPYANVLKNCLGRGSELSVSIQESLLAWQILTPVLEAWEQGYVPMEQYSAGISVPDFGQKD